MPPDIISGESSGGKHLKLVLEVTPPNVHVVPKVLGLHLSSFTLKWIEEVIRLRGVDLWLSGPPCRTISLLRHKKDEGPEPLRGGREEDRFGLPGLKDQQQQQADDDSVLWLRNLWWMWLNKMHHPRAKNLIEQPQDPNEWYQNPRDEDLYPSFFFLARCCLGQVPGGAPFSQRSEQATACTNRMQIRN